MLNYNKVKMSDDLRDEKCPSGFSAAPIQNDLAKQMGWYEVDTTPSAVERKAGITHARMPIIDPTRWPGVPSTWAEVLLLDKWDTTRWNAADYEGAKAFQKTVELGNPDYCLNLQKQIDYEGTECHKWYNPITLEFCTDTDDPWSADCIRAGSECCRNSGGTWPCGECRGKLELKSKDECDKPIEQHECTLRANRTYQEDVEKCAREYTSCRDANCKTLTDADEIQLCDDHCKIDRDIGQCVQESKDKRDQTLRGCSKIVNYHNWVSNPVTCPKCSDIVYCDQTGKRAVMWQHRDKFNNRVLQHRDANGTKAVYPKCKDLRYAQVRGRGLSCSDYYEINPEGTISKFCMDNDDDTKPCKAMDDVDDPEDMVNSGCHDRCTTPAFLDNLGGSFSQHGDGDLANDAQEVTRCETEYVPSLENVPTHCSAEQKSNLCDWIVGGNVGERCHKPSRGGQDDMCHLNLVCTQGSRRDVPRCHNP